MTAVAEKEVVPFGRFIYAFCNVRTNQVLYSLSRTLDNSALKQLPDLGANHTPPVLRKDLWRPLYQVELPATPDGAKQGLHAFRKLREYRKLHELSWEQTSMMTRNHTDKEIEKEKKKLESRGGSKKETVYDIIKRQKHKMKVKMVMDQKANSIADLAAVLLEQQDGANQPRASKWRTWALQQVESLVRQAENGGIEKLSKRIATMRDSLRAMLKNNTKGQQEKLRRRIRGSERRLQKMRHAAKIAKKAQAEAEEIERLAREAESGMPKTISKEIARLEKRLQKGLGRIHSRRVKREFNELRGKIREAKEQLRKMQTAAETVKAFRARAEPTKKGIPEQTFVAAYRREAMLSFAETFDPAPLDPKDLTKRGQEIETRTVPTYTTEGITVKWANIMDVEYAGMWPDAVQHKRMGYTTRSPPLIDYQTVAEYKALSWMSRRENFQLDESTAEKVERLRAEMGWRPRADIPWKLEKVNELGSGSLPGREPSQVEMTAVESAEGEVEVAQEKVEVAQEKVEVAQEKVEVAQETFEAAQETFEAAQETVEAAQETFEVAQETVEEAAVEDPNRLEGIQKSILAEVQKKAARESWDRRAELDLKRAMNKYKLAPLPADAPVDQQPTI